AGVGLVESGADGELVGRLRAGGEGALVLEEGQEHVVGVVVQGRGKEGEVAGDARIGAIHATCRVQDRIGGVARVGAALRQHLYRAAVDRGRTADIDAITLAGGIDFD